MEKQRFWTGVLMIIAGITMLFISMFIPPKGHISSSVLGAFGEISLLAGCLCGCDAYITYKLKKIVHNDNQKVD